MSLNSEISKRGATQHRYTPSLSPYKHLSLPLSLIIRRFLPLFFFPSHSPPTDDFLSF